VSQSLAKRYWPSGDAVGRRLTIQDQSREIVGIVADVRQSLLAQGQGQSSQDALYIPYAQHPVPTPFLLVRSRVSPTALIAPIRNELTRVDSRVSIGTIQTMQAFVDQFFVGANFFNAILTGFGALALLLASMGTYGVLAYNVAGRYRELGVRMALGAGPSRILRMVARQGVTLGVIGLAVGAPGVYALTRVINSILVYSPPVDPVTILAVFTALFLSTLAASYIPARRAAALNPVAVLRSE